MKKIILLGALMLTLAGCGGGGGSAGACNGSSQVCFPPVETPAPGPGVVETPAPGPVAVESLANICTPTGEKNWLRAHLDDVYLWYNEIVNVAPLDYATPADYFYALLVRARDRFSFTVSQAVIDQYFLAGQDVGYGATFVNDSGRLRVSYTQPQSPAEQQNLVRGAEIVGINGVSLSAVDGATKNAALYPSKAGTTTQFQVLDPGAAAARTVPLSSITIRKYPVPISKIITTAENKKLGYLVFTDHIATAEDPLITTLTQFQKNGIDDLVLDLRYNGGGFLYIASQVGSMIGGGAVKNKVFEQLRFNAKHQEKTNAPDNTFLFFDTSTTNKPLPQLNLKRVFVLIGAGTCSASESIINGLSPHVEVILVGGTTCGKPYGMMQKNNCSQAYFAIEFDGINSAGQGGYTAGFAPKCAAADDLEHQLGDVNERLLSSAISYSKTGSCPAADSLFHAPAVRDALMNVREVYRAPWRDNRIVKP